MIEKVNLDEYPALPDLRSRYDTRTRFVLQRDRMNLEERSGLLQSERNHLAVTRNRPSRRAFVDRSR